MTENLSKLKKPTKTRVIPAPPPTSPYIIPSIYSIELDESLDVEWKWLELPDGNKVVIDYRIYTISNN